MKSLIAVLFAASAAAIPASVPASPDLSVTAAELDAFALYAQYAAAAYCNSDAAVGAAVACPAKADPTMSTCPAVEAAGVAVAAVLRAPATGVEGFVAHDAARRAVVVAFRGSHGYRDVLTDLDLAQAPCAKYLAPALARRIGPACAVHDGFGAAWAALRNSTLAAVAAVTAVTAAAAAADPETTTSLVLTGHSLGAAVATLAAAELRDQGTACALYTYGSPRVGSTALAAHVTIGQQAAVLPAAGTTADAVAAVANYRVTHRNDPIPQLPGLDLDYDYAHTSPEFWLAGPGDPAHAAFRGAVAYRPADVRVCPGFANVSCNGGEQPANMDAHMSYFEPISGCASPWRKAGSQAAAVLQ